MITILQYELIINSFRKCMKWYLIPYELKFLRLLLFRKFRVNQIPTAIIIDENGKIINNDVVSNLEKDPEGRKFPWVPPSLKSMLGDVIQWKNIDIRSSQGSEENFYR